MAKYDNDEIIAQLKSLADRLGKKTLSKTEVSRSLDFSVSTLRYRFGSFGKALESAGLQVASPNSLMGIPKLTDNDLFSALYEFEVKHGREPTYSSV